ncbi:Hypothetical predicted protein [Octopus vulgaris]|uniref:Uncharacterized protein n=1 Tax=Octopus vulgaris TaxID=6645 RepID=A0AA36AU41_OCTVU|nr:Hypothetical predicted protein [Octopus vulgaris]
MTAFLKENDEEQMTITALINKMKEFLEDINLESYGFTHMKEKLLDHFGERIIITKINVFQNIVTFRVIGFVIDVVVVGIGDGDGFEPDYRCQHLDNKTLMGLRQEIETNIKVYYQECEINVRKENKPDVERTLTCVNSYNYSTGKYKSFISEWDLVCDQEEFGKLVTTVFHVGMMIGAALFPSLADKSIDESIRWLIAKDRWTEAKRLIKKAAKKNDVDYDQVAYVYRHFDPLGSEASHSDTSSHVIGDVVDSAKLNSIEPSLSAYTGEIPTQITNDTEYVDSAHKSSNSFSPKIQNKNVHITSASGQLAKQINANSSKINSAQTEDRNIDTAKNDDSEIRNVDSSNVCLEGLVVNTDKHQQRDFQLTESTSCHQTVYVNVNIENNCHKQAEDKDAVVNDSSRSSQHVQDTNFDIKTEDTVSQQTQKLNTDAMNILSKRTNPTKANNIAKNTSLQDIHDINEDIGKVELQQTNNILTDIVNTNVNFDEMYSTKAEYINADLDAFQQIPDKNDIVLKRTLSAVMTSHIHIQNEDLGIRTESMPSINKTLPNSIHDNDRHINASNETDDNLGTYNDSSVSQEALQVDRNIYNENNFVKCNGRLPEIEAGVSEIAAITELMPINTIISEQQREKPSRAHKQLTETAVRSRCQLPGMLYIIKEPVLRRIVFICLYLWFVNTLVYYGLYFTSETLAGNRYLNFFLYALAEFPSQVLALKLLIRIGRKKTCILFQSIAGGSLIVAVILRMSSSD